MGKYEKRADRKEIMSNKTFVSKNATVGKNVKISDGVVITDGARVLGDVTLAENVNIWFNAVVRGDYDKITIGKNTNVQDNCVIHMEADSPVTIGADVTIGHGAILHGCTIGDHTLIGMGAIVLNGAVIGKNCLIAGGALVTENAVIPDNSVVMGMPGKVKREIADAEMAHMDYGIDKYIKAAWSYAEEAEL